MPQGNGVVCGLGGCVGAWVRGWVRGCDSCGGGWVGVWVGGVVRARRRRWRRRWRRRREGGWGGKGRGVCGKLVGGHAVAAVEVAAAVAMEVIFKIYVTNTKFLISMSEVKFWKIPHG